MGPRKYALGHQDAKGFTRKERTYICSSNEQRLNAVDKNQVQASLLPISVRIEATPPNHSSEGS